MRPVGAFRGGADGARARNARARDEHRACVTARERRPARNRLGREWLSAAAGPRPVQPKGTASPSSRQGCAASGSRQGCADLTSRQGCADLTSRQGCADLTSRQGGNERGRLARSGPDEVSTARASEVSEEARSEARPVERAGGFQAVLVMLVSCRSEPGAFEAVFRSAVAFPQFPPTAKSKQHQPTCMAESVLVPVDGSPLSVRAFEHALETFPDAEITVLHVIDLFDAEYGAGRETTFEPMIGTEEWYEVAQAGTEQLFEEVEEIAAEHDREVKTESEVGDPERIVPDYAAEEEVDHLVLGAHGRPDPNRPLFGRVAETVAERAGVPVTLIR